MNIRQVIVHNGVFNPEDGMRRLSTVIMFILAFHSVAASPVVYHLEVALLEADGGLVHTFDCIAGSDICGGVVADDPRYADAPVKLFFTIQAGCARLQFEREQTQLVDGAGNMQFCLNLTNTGRTEQSFTLYDSAPNAIEGGVQTLIVTRGAHPVETAHVTLRQSAPNP